MAKQYDPVLVSIGRKIIERREAIGMTATELAILADVTASALSLYESGQRSMGVDKLHRIASALRVPLSYFQDEELDAFSDYPTELYPIIEQLKQLPIEKQQMMLKMFSAQMSVL